MSGLEGRSCEKGYGRLQKSQRCTTMSLLQSQVARCHFLQEYQLTGDFHRLTLSLKTHPKVRVRAAPRDLPTAGGSWPRTSSSASGTGPRPPRCRPGSASTGRARPSMPAFPSWTGLPFLPAVVTRGATRHATRGFGLRGSAAVSPCRSTDRTGKLTEEKVPAAD